jgi:hypothetical protein
MSTGICVMILFTWFRFSTCVTMTLTKSLLVKLIVTRYIKSLLCPFCVSHFKMKQNRKHRQNIDFMYLVINQIFYFIYILIFSIHVNKSYRDFGKVALWSFNYTMILPNLQPIKTYTNDSLPMTRFSAVPS